MKVIEAIGLLVLLMVIGLWIKYFVQKFKINKNEIQQTFENNRKFYVIYYLFTVIFIIYTLFLFIPIIISINKHTDNKIPSSSETIYIDHYNGNETAFGIGIVILLLGIIIKRILNKKIRRDQLFALDIVINAIIFIILLFLKIVFSFT